MAPQLDDSRFNSKFGIACFYNHWNILRLPVGTKKKIDMRGVWCTLMVSIELNTDQLKVCSYLPNLTSFHGQYYTCHFLLFLQLWNDFPVKFKSIFNQFKSSLKTWRRRRGLVDKPWFLICKIPGSNLRAVAFVSLGKTVFLHYLSPPKSINGYPVGCDRYLVNQHLCAWFGQLSWNTPQGVENLCTLCTGKSLNPMTGVIILVQRFQTL